MQWSQRGEGWVAPEPSPHLLPHRPAPWPEDHLLTSGHTPQLPQALLSPLTFSSPPDVFLPTYPHLPSTRHLPRARPPGTHPPPDPRCRPPPDPARPAPQAACSPRVTALTRCWAGSKYYLLNAEILKSNPEYTVTV